MSGIEDPGTPPEVPEEYAAVYREAYQRALEEGGMPPAKDVAPEPGPEPELLPGLRGTFTTVEDRRPPGSVILGVGAVFAVLLVLAAFVIGRLLSHDDPGTSASSPTATAGHPTPTKTSPSPHRTPTPTKVATSAGAVYNGAVQPVTISGISAGCTSAPGVDAAGQPVRYDAANAIDGDPTTAWRCDGQAVGTVLTLTLPDRTQVGELGLIGGYAKTDPDSGADRYAENNRITRVRWTLANGVVVEQTLSGAPSNRSVQTIRVPRTATGTVQLQILAVARGSRNTTAISEIAVAAAH